MDFLFFKCEFPARNDVVMFPLATKIPYPCVCQSCSGFDSKIGTCSGKIKCRPGGTDSSTAAGQVFSRFRTNSGFWPAVVTQPGEKGGRAHPFVVYDRHKLARLGTSIICL